MTVFPCPHCGGEIVGEIVVVSGPAPLPGWRNPDATGATSQAQQQAQLGGVAPVAQEHLGSKQLGSRSKNFKTYTRNFLDFWEAYPRHRDKLKAFGAWRNAVDRLAATTGATATQAQAQIMEGALRYRNDPGREDQYTKYAEGWLNGDGWEDEPLPPRIRPGARPPDPPRPMTSGEMDRAIERAFGTEDPKFMSREEKEARGIRE